MNDIRANDWRDALDPPPGGLTRLVDAIESSRARGPRLRPRFALIGAGAMTAAVAVFGLALQIQSNSPQHRLRSALEAALNPDAQDTGIRVDNGAAAEIPSANPNVRMYWIAQLPPAAAEPARP